MVSAPAWIPLLVAGNALALAAMLVTLGMWVRRLFRTHVSDPINNLRTSVDNLSTTDAALEAKVTAATELAIRANDRIDQMLLGEQHA